MDKYILCLSAQINTDQFVRYLFSARESLALDIGLAIPSSTLLGFVTTNFHVARTDVRENPCVA